MVEVSDKSKYFTFIKDGIGYTFKSVAPSISGEGHTIFGLRRVFDNYEEKGYKYISPSDYEKIYYPLLYIRMNED